jgi:hypothetical protein
MPCKDNTPPCPSDCVTYNFKGEKRCRAKPTRKAEGEKAAAPVAPKPAYASKSTKPAVKYVPKAVQKAMVPPAPVYAPAPVVPREKVVPKPIIEPTVPKYLKAQAEYEKKEKGHARANYQSFMANNAYGESLRGLFEQAEFNARRSSDRTRASNVGEVVEMKVVDALRSKGLNSTQIEAALVTPELSTYIKLRSKLTLAERAEVETAVRRVNAKLNALKDAKGKIPAAAKTQVDAILKEDRICDLIILEIGRVYKSGAKKSGEATEKDLEVVAKALGVKTSTLSKAGLCFVLGTIMSNSEEQFVAAFLSDKKYQSL